MIARIYYHTNLNLGMYSVVSAGNLILTHKRTKLLTPMIAYYCSAKRKI